MTISNFAKHLKEARSVLIFSHVRPDGDTLGSAMAVKAALDAAGVKTALVCPSPIPEKYASFPLAAEFLQDAPNESFDAHLSVDCSTESMLYSFAPLFFSNKKTFNIDHHVSNTKYAKYNCVIDSASCGENIYMLLKELGAEFNRDVAEYLLLGIVTDTGCFAHKNVTPKTLNIAAELVGMGADLNAINYKMFKAQSVSRARLFAIAASSLKLYHGDRLAVINMRLEDFEKTGATPDMTEGMIDFALNIYGVEVAVSIMETKKQSFKISFRSKGSVDVNAVAGTFGGGGHILASGCMLNGFFEDVADKLVFTVGNYL